MIFSAPPSQFDPASIPFLILSSPLKFALYTVHNFITALRSPPKTSNPPIRIVCISDTHSLTAPIPDGDILIHAGDLTKTGTPSELQATLTWLDSLPHAHKIIIAGNHDTYLDPRSRATLPAPDHSATIDWLSLIYLQHSSKALTFPSSSPSGPNPSKSPVTPTSAPQRRLNIHGAPQIPTCGGPDFAFQHDPNLDAWSNTIPPQTDILITHTPPKHHLDLALAPSNGLGCPYLLSEIWRVRPRLHICGHVHAGRGTTVLYWDEAQRAYEAGCARPDGLVWSSLDVRLWICFWQVVLFGLVGLVWGRVWGGREDGCVLVNASLMFNNTGRLGNEAQVVEI